MTVAISTTSNDLLRDTLTLVHLARETAVARGRTDQAERLTPVVDDLKKAVTVSQQPPASPTSSNILGQSDFRTLLSAIESSPQQSGARSASSAERSQIVVAMSAGGMQEVDIARQMGMSRDEVRTLVQIANRKNKVTGEST